jgi:tetratricopeptide (TPR) repeat protein
MMRLRRVKRWVWATASSAAAVVVLALGILVVPGIFFGESLRPTHYLLGSLVEGGQPAATAASRLLEVAMYGAVRRVPGITLEESTRVIDRLLRTGGADRVDDWLEIARSVGAGHAIIYSVIPFGDSVEVIAWEYEVRTGRMVDRETGWVPAGTELGAEAARLVERLFDLEDGSITVRASASAEADRAYVEGRTALKSWDLRTAETEFRRAVEEDPDFAQAQLSLAQVKWWARDTGDEWLVSARRAVQLRDDLEPRDADLALALLSLAQDQYPEACEHFRAVVAADSSDFSGWLGLGDCQAHDKVVLRDETSPSRWRYRSSYHGAVMAYERALQTVPSYTFSIAGDAFSGLQQILARYAEPHNYRGGFPLLPDTGLFAAQPALQSDTLAFVPHRALDVFNAVPGTQSATHGEAMEWVRGRLRGVVRDWADAFPDSSAPIRAVARTLELDGALEGRGTRRSALTATREARRLARGADDSLAADVVEVRVLLKLERFGEAQRLASDALESRREPTMEQAKELAGLAAVLGLPNRSAELAAAAAPLVQADSGEGIGLVGLPIVEARQRAIAYASVGAPSDSVARIASRLEDLLSLHVTPEEAERTRCRVLWYPLEIAFPVLRRAAADERCRRLSYMERLQWQLVNGDSAGVRSTFRWLDSLRGEQRAGDLSIDGVFLEAWILVELGDTAAAVRRLDRSLGALRGHGTHLVTEMPQAGGLVKAMALRAALAAAVGDTAIGRRWAEAVVVLWSDAEVDELQATVRAMQDLMTP